MPKTNKPYIGTGDLVRLVGHPLNRWSLHRLRRYGLVSAVNLGKPDGGQSVENALWDLPAILKCKVWASARNAGIDGKRLIKILRNADHVFGEGRALEQLLSGDAVLVANWDGSSPHILVKETPERLVELMSKQIVLPLGELKDFRATVERIGPPESRGLRFTKNRKAATA